MFVPNNVIKNISSPVLSLLLTLYSRMCGKNFSMKLLHKHASLKKSTRTRQVVVANPMTCDKEQRKKTKKNNDKVDNDLNRHDHASFQNSFCYLRDHIIKEHDDLLN